MSPRIVAADANAEANALLSSTASIDSAIYASIAALILNAAFDGAYYVCCRMPQRPQTAAIDSFLNAKLLFFKCDYSGCLNVLSKFEESIGSNKECLLLAVDALMKLGRHSDAIKRLEEFVHAPSFYEPPTIQKPLWDMIQPQTGNFEALRQLRLCQAYRILGNVPKAIHAASMACSLDPQNPQIAAFVDAAGIRMAPWLYARDNDPATPPVSSVADRVRKAYLAASFNCVAVSYALTHQLIKCSFELVFPLHIANLYARKDRIAAYELCTQLQPQAGAPKSVFLYVSLGTLQLICAVDSTSHDHPSSLLGSSVEDRQKSRVKRSTPAECVEAARRAFCKATLMSPTCLWAWEGFAFSFGASFDYDQAVAAYCTLSRLAPQLSFPYACVGRQYLAAENYALALRYLSKAASIDCRNADAISSAVPVHSFALLHELGCVHFKLGNFERALNYFYECNAVLQAEQFSLSENRRMLAILHTNIAYCLCAVAENSDLVDSSHIMSHFRMANTYFSDENTFYGLAIGLALTGKFSQAIDTLHLLYNRSACFVSSSVSKQFPSSDPISRRSSVVENDCFLLLDHLMQSYVSEPIIGSLAI